MSDHPGFFYRNFLRSGWHNAGWRDRSSFVNCYVTSVRRAAWGLRLQVEVNKEQTMKSAACLILLLSTMLIVSAQSPTVVNFNLVQVNRYDKSDTTGARECLYITLHPRVVVDMQNSRSMVEFFGSVSSGTQRPVVAVTPVAENDAPGSEIPWETGNLIHAAMGQDSFMVRSSRIGCPGTEVRPSVSVAFANGQSWSDPPIRFGPLCERTVCPLGHGYQLEVMCKGNDAPSVRLIEPDAYSGRR
jgi:hypothetical protein